MKMMENEAFEFEIDNRMRDNKDNHLGEICSFSSTTRKDELSTSDESGTSEQVYFLSILLVL